MVFCLVTFFSTQRDEEVSQRDAEGKRGFGVGFELEKVDFGKEFVEFFWAELNVREV
jgi:hypothetical protein